MRSTRLAGPVSPETKGQAELADRLQRLFGEAARSSGGFHDFDFDLAGHPVRLRFAGSSLSEPLIPALAHLETAADTEPDLTVHLWDSRSTETDPVSPPWQLEDFRELGVIRGYFGDGFFSVYDRGPQALNVVELEQQRAFYWMRNTERLSLWEHASPLRTLFHLWLGEQGIQLTHGAAVGHPDGCVLLVGNSGAGKTSTALSCLRSELQHLGDDYVPIVPGDPPEVAGLYSTAKADPAALRRLPELEQLVVSPPAPGGEKALLDLHKRAPGKVLAKAPLRAVAVTRISGEPQTRVKEIPSSAALAAVAPSTLLQLPGNGQPAIQRLGAIVRSVPCVQLDVGTDPAVVGPAIEAILDR
jgi:hypothetical protein